MATPPDTKLGRAFAPQPKPDSAAGPATRLLAALSGARPWKPVTLVVRGQQITGMLTLLGSARELDIEGEVARAMELRGLPYDLANETAWELERAARVLAEAVYDDDPTKRADPPRFGTPADWGNLPKETLANLYRSYLDHAAENDPVVDSLTVEQAALIRAAVQKKSAPLLRSFGVAALAAFLLSTDDAPASSPTPKSSPGDSSPES